MATAVIKEDEDLMTCGVCFNRYDLEDRKPKFLQCSHTICLPCAKVIFQECVICCPFCRLTYFIGSADSLPNNTYAAQLLELIQRNKQTSESAPNKEGSIEWCLGCQSAISSLCTALGHSTINITPEIMKNMEQTVQLKTELTKMKDQGINTLAQVIEKRKQIREHLGLVMNSIHLVEDEVRKLQDDNDLMLAKVVSILESNKKPISDSAVGSDEKRNSFTSEFTSIVEDFHPEDSLETLKFKLKKALDVYDKYLKEATSATSSYDHLENMKITVALNNNKKAEPVLTLNLTSKKNRSKPEVMLLSHSILSLLDNQSVPPTSANLTTLPKSVNLSSSFVLGQSMFILKYYWSCLIVDELWIQPCIAYDNEFIQKLGMFCYKSPKTLDSVIKAVPDVHLALYSAHAFPDYVARTSHKGNSHLVTKALKENEIGLEIVQFPTKKNATIEWKMVFPLKKFSDPKFKMHVAGNRAELFGKLIKSKSETLMKLSTTSNTTRSTYVTFTLESV